MTQIWLVPFFIVWSWDPCCCCLEKYVLFFVLFKFLSSPSCCPFFINVCCSINQVHFGYIYGFSVFGCLGMYALLNLLSDSSVIDIWLTCSVLGYCLLPVICLAGIAVVLKLQSILGLLLSIIAVIWSSHAATRLFLSKMALQPAAYYYLIAYPSMLLYSAFVLITIF